MAGFPQYLVSEASFLEANAKLSQLGLVVECVKEKQFITENDAYYREWRVAKNDDVQVIMWDEHPQKREDDKVVVSVGTPSGRKGINLLNIVQETLIEHGAIRQKK